jgi:hypothetical protein
LTLPHILRAFSAIASYNWFLYPRIRIANPPRSCGKESLTVIHLERFSARGFIPWLIAIAWITAMATGFHRMASYETTPGPLGAPPVSWPTSSRLSRIEGVPNVFMAVHPRCPCTRSSLTILGEIAQRSPAGSSIRLLVYRPMVAGPGWDDPPLPARAASTVLETVADPGGTEAERFGLATSGAVIAFDALGLWQITGGLNTTRGRTEISGGGLALLAILDHKEPQIHEAKAYGCPVRAPENRRTSGGQP